MDYNRLFASINAFVKYSKRAAPLLTYRWQWQTWAMWGKFRQQTSHWSYRRTIARIQSSSTL